MRKILWTITISCFLLCIIPSLRAYIPEEWQIENVGGDIAKVDKLAKEKDVESLIAMLNATDNEIVKRVIVRNLGDIGSEKAIQALLKIVPSSDFDLVKPRGSLEQLNPLQILSVIALVRIQARKKSEFQQIPLLLNLLKPRPHVYQYSDLMTNEVIRALGGIDPKLISKEYVDLPSAQLSLLQWEIKGMPEKRKIEKLMEILTKQQISPPRREAAVEFLIDLGAPVVPYLIEILQTSDIASIPEAPPYTERHELVHNAVTIAMGISDKRVIPALEHLSLVGCSYFRTISLKALKLIRSGIPYPHKYMRLMGD
jgi:HEAT repeat protein